jgi:hypothetical protein
MPDTKKEILRALNATLARIIGAGRAASDAMVAATQAAEDVRYLIGYATENLPADTDTQTPEEPAAPTNLSVDVSVPGKARMAWQHVAGGVRNFFVFHSPDVPGRSNIFDVSADDRTYTFDMPPGVFEFHVSAVYGSEESDESEAISVTAEVKPVVVEQPDGVVDGIPYPVLPALNVQPGADLAKLTADGALPRGEYVTSGNITKNVSAQTPGTVTLKLKPKQCPKLPDVFAGIKVVGGGIPNSDELKTAGPIAGALVHSCEFTESEGFGLLTSRSGDVRVTQCEIHHNGSGGIGGTGSKMVALVDNCHIHHNNLKHRRTNSNKFTRGKITCRNNRYHDNAGVDIWADNYVQELTILDSTFAGTQVDKDGDRWTAANVRGEISDKLTVRGCTFENDVTAALSLDELHGATIVGNRFKGKAKMAMELRDNARGEPFHSLKDVTISGNVFESNALNIVPSGNISLSRHRINIGADNRWPDNKVAEHVTVKA